MGSAIELSRDSLNVRAKVRVHPALNRTQPILKRMVAFCQHGELVPAMVERILGAEPMLQAKLAQALAVYTTRRNIPMVGSVGEAVTSLGWNVVQELVLLCSLHLFNADICQKSNLPIMPLSQQAYAMAGACEALDIEPHFGIVANIGIAGMIALYGSEYVELLRSLAGVVVPLDEVETQAYGHDHGLIGSLLLTEAGFSTPISKAVQTHTDPSGSIWMAEAIAHQLSFDGGIAAAPPELPVIINDLNTSLDKLLQDLMNRGAEAVEMLR